MIVLLQFFDQINIIIHIHDTTDKYGMMPLNVMMQILIETPQHLEQGKWRHWDIAPQRLDSSIDT